MNSLFSVTVPTSSPGLLTAAELRAAAGLAVGDTSQDTTLTALGLQVSATLARRCGVADDGVNVPTLLSETCSEVFRLPKKREQIRLARRPVSAITSVVEEGTTLTGTDYEVSKPTGLFSRIAGDRPICWPCGKITVVYVAGLASATPDLKLAASKLTTALFTETARDPSLKRERVDDISEREYWVSPSDDPLLTAEIDDLLTPYKQVW